MIFIPVFSYYLKYNLGYQLMPCRYVSYRMQVGRGDHPGVGQFMEHVKPNGHHVIQAVGVSTGWSATGRFELYNVDGRVLIIYSLKDPGLTAIFSLIYMYLRSKLSI
jgi:hypothetical protein